MGTSETHARLSDCQRDVALPISQLKSPISWAITEKLVQKCSWRTVYRRLRLEIE